MGGLLLLFFILVTHALSHVSDTHINAGVFSKAEDTNVHISEMTAFQKITLGEPISINRESLEGLTAVPGIGPRIAGSIVKERDKKGGFKNLDEIKSINGVGSKLYERIKYFLIL